jgi:hypothetical protein
MMFGVSVSIDRVWLRRLAVGLAPLVLVVTPAAARADGSSVTTCTAQAREALVHIGSWATAQCDTQALSFAGNNQPDPAITALLNETGEWAAQAYTTAADAHETGRTLP